MKLMSTRWLKKTPLLATVGCMLLFNTACNTPKATDELEHKDVTHYVNPFIGSAGHGHTFPGATVPFGMVQLSPDNGVQAWDWCSGYHYTKNTIIGFSHTHLSGTGIGDLADISVLPITDSYDFTKEYKEHTDKPWIATFSHDNEKAEPGFYSVKLDNGVDVQLTASERVGFHHYTFAETVENPELLLDLNFAINWDQATSVELEQIDARTFKGHRFSKGWAPDQRLYFYMQFDQDVELKTYENGRYLFKLPSHEIELKVALSPTGLKGAEKNYKAEALTKDFIQAKEQAHEKWQESLQGFYVKGGSLDQRTTFYTAMYHAKVAPVIFNDVDGSYPDAKTKEVKKGDFDRYSVFSLWDTYRTAHTLYLLTERDKVADMVNTMINIFDETGRLPVWELHGNETGTMCGIHSIPVIAEAVLKGVKGVDAEAAFKAIDASLHEPYEGVDILRKYGYMPYDKINESVSVGQELAIDDYAASLVAKKLGKTEKAAYYLDYADSYKEYWDPETKFFRATDSKGNFKEPFDPREVNHRKNPYVEGNAWQYLWLVPQQPDTLIKLIGGREAFAERLDSLFNMSSELTGEDISPDVSGLVGQYAHGNEPSHHIIYFYNRAGQPWKAQEMVRRVMNEMYTNEPLGLPGNEDCGQMSAWYIMSAIGLYPINPSSGIYDIGSPLFEEIAVDLADNKQFVIKANGNNATNIYIQSAKLNGQDLNRSWITHKELMAGGTLELEMGAEPNKSWATEPANLAPETAWDF